LCMYYHVLFDNSSLTIVIEIRTCDVRALGCNARLCMHSLEVALDLYGEFDPGSERTLAAYLTHASRTRKGTSVSEYSGARVRNT
jgi:hypothetical protein